MFSTYANERVTIVSQTVDQWGGLGTERRRSIRCRIMRGQKLVTDLGGKQVVSTAQLIVPANQRPPTLEDKIEMDGGTRSIIGRYEIRDFRGRGWEIALS